MENKISVIVPIYNVEKYLVNCVESIRNQTYDNLEIILVDDGSKDKSGDICDNFGRTDARIKVIHKQNGGLSDARNAGIDLATGDYISFVDGDDTINTDALEVLIKAIKEKDTAISKIGFNSTNVSKIPESDETIGNNYKAVVIKNQDFIRMFCTYKASCSFCDKLFSRRVFEHYRFKTGRTNEDLLLLATILIENQYDISVVDYNGYNYFQRQNSITKAKFGRSITDSIYNCDELINLAKEIRPEIALYFSQLALFQVRNFLILMPNSYVAEKNQDYLLAMKLLKENKALIKNAFFSWKDKIFLYLFNVSPYFAKNILKLRRVRR